MVTIQFDETSGLLLLNARGRQSTEQLLKIQKVFESEKHLEARDWGCAKNQLVIKFSPPKSEDTSSKRFSLFGMLKH